MFGGMRKIYRGSLWAPNWYACEAQAAEEDMEESGSTEKEDT
jgi:hypothetical protein